MPENTDWISAVCAVIAAIVAVVTLLTVYVAALHILQRRQAYQLGASKKSLGEWKPLVVSPSSWKMQTDIKTPIISIPRLIAQCEKQKFELEFSMPMGNEPKLIHMVTNDGASVSTRLGSPNAFITAPRLSLKPRSSKLSTRGTYDPEPTATQELEPGMTATTSRLAVTSWVNFLEALGLGPAHASKDADLVRLQTQSDLLNGIVPMRWKGKDLVAICSILGFQFHESEAQAKDDTVRLPMLLPAQWSGPLGWVQFREGNHGCVAEFRRRADVIVTTDNQLLSETNQISTELHSYYAKFPQGRAIALVPRLWHSVGGLALPGKQALYLGGADEDESRAPVVNMVSDAGTKSDAQQGDDPEANRLPASNINNIFKTMIDSDLSHDALVELLDTDNENNCPVDDDQIETGMEDNYYEGLARGQRIEVLLPSPGLLSTVLSGEMASSRGLLQNDQAQDIPKSSNFIVSIPKQTLLTEADFHIDLAPLLWI